MPRRHPHRCDYERSVNPDDHQLLWSLVIEVEHFLYGDPMERPPTFPPEGLPPRVEKAVSDIIAHGSFDPTRSAEAERLSLALLDVIHRLRAQSRGA